MRGIKLYKEITPRIFPAKLRKMKTMTVKERVEQDLHKLYKKEQKYTQLSQDVENEYIQDQHIFDTIILPKLRKATIKDYKDWLWGVY